MPRKSNGKSSFPRRKPRFRRGRQRAGIPFRPIEGGGETTDYGKAKLYGIFRDGRRVYLPPREMPGIPEEEANRMVERLPGAEVVKLYDPDDAA